MIRVISRYVLMSLTSNLFLLHSVFMLGADKLASIKLSVIAYVLY